MARNPNHTLEASSQADVATQAKWLTETMTYLTQLVQEHTARLGGYPAQSSKRQTRGRKKFKRSCTLLEKPVALLTHPDVVNAVQGTFESPDPIQRRRFEAFAAYFEGVPFEDIMPLLAPLERAKRRSGRKAKSDPDAAVLEKMHALLTSSAPDPYTRRQRGLRRKPTEAERR